MAYPSHARSLSEKLVRKLSNEVALAAVPDTALLRDLAHAHYVAGYSIGINTHSYEATLANEHFHDMELLARDIEDQPLLNLALTYQGDTYRRKGDIQEAKTYLEAAPQTHILMDAAMRGNNLQLLCRVYLQMNDLVSFEYTMKVAEQLAGTIEPDTSILHGQYCLGTVYEEYARSYGNLGQVQRALQYLDKAQAAFPSLPHWHLLLTTTRALVLVKGGEISQGTSIAVQAAQLCRRCGNIRLLERIRELQRFLDRQALQAKKSAIELDDALNDLDDESSFQKMQTRASGKKLTG
jgi:tetratricopeptide (TPR) repeat protein